MDLLCGGIVDHCGFTSESQIEEGSFGLFTIVLMFMLVAKVGEEATRSGRWGTNATAATSTSMDTVAAALSMDHCE